METKHVEQDVFQFRPLTNDSTLVPGHFRRGRSLIGRSESCDFVIPRPAISAVHAVIEVTSRGGKIFDMNSKNGTLVNGQKIVAKELRVGDRVTFGNIEYIFEVYMPRTEFPPVLESLDPSFGSASIIRTQPVPEMAVPSSVTSAPLPQAPAQVEEEDVPYIVYPLAKDPKADYSEYIFEDADELYPIFKYEHSKMALEVIILYNDRVYSVDYIPEKNGVYKIVGSMPRKAEVEFPYLAAKESVPFIEVRNGNCLVKNLHNYEMLHLTDSEIKESNNEVNLQGNDIVKLVNGSLEIYVRKVSAPPKVKSAPFFRRDKNLKKYILLALIFVLTPIIGLSLFEVNEELEKEKDPERIARILYKQPLTVSKSKAVEKTENKPKVEQKVKNEVTEKKVEQEKKVVEKQPDPVPVKKPTPRKRPGTRTAKKVQTVKRVKNPAPKSPVPRAKPATARTRSRTLKTSASAARPTKTRGAVDTFKSFNFKSSVNNLMAKGGTVTGVKSSATDSSAIGSTNIGGGVSDSLKKADATSEVGSLTGAAVGKLADSKGVEGISAKKGIYTAGIPSETVILGSMDPDVIRRILREHIPQFRYCYQQELDRHQGRKISDTVRLDFQIGASGHVTRAGVSSNLLPADAKRCVARVLKGIAFPAPRGGGVVDVKQPINFYPVER